MDNHFINPKLDSKNVECSFCGLFYNLNSMRIIIFKKSHEIICLSCLENCLSNSSIKQDLNYIYF